MSLGKASKSKIATQQATRANRPPVRMKRLTLVRHAKSDWSLPDQQDWDRVSEQARPAGCAGNGATPALTQVDTDLDPLESSRASTLHRQHHGP